MPKVNAYVTFPGNCEEAFNYYKSLFGDEFIGVNRFSEMPPQEGMPGPMAKTFWGEYFGMCTDQFNTGWMISFREDEK